MQNVERCQHCILPVTLPSVQPDDRGICGLCADYRHRQEASRGSDREKNQAFEALIERARKLGRPYDCLVPLSGGKDSTYALYLCDRVYKLKCLCVTFDNGYLSDRARKNIASAINSTRADHIMFFLNRTTMLELYKLFIRKTGTFCPACLRGIGLAINTAQNYRIPLTVSGTGWQVTYLAGVPELYQEGTSEYFRNVVKGEPIERDVRPLTQEARRWDLARVGKIASRLFKLPQLSKSHYIRLYDYFSPNYEMIYRTIQDEMGWSAADGKGAEHLDCELHDVAGYLHHLKFPDLTGHTVHRSGLIRMRHLERAAALTQDLEELSQTKAPENLGPFLEEMGLSMEEFRSSTRDWRKVTRFRTSRKNRLRSLYHKLTRQ